MPSTKRYFTLLACGLVLALCGTLAAADGHEGEGRENTLRTTFSGDFWMMNPCPGADPTFFKVSGTNFGFFHQNKHHDSVHFRYLANGSDSVGQPVKGFVYAKVKSDPINNLSSLTPDNAVTYMVPLESIWVDNNGSQSWTFSSWVELAVDKTGLFAANLHPELGFSIQCTGPMDANAPDHRFHHDNDEDDDRR